MKIAKKMSAAALSLGLVLGLSGMAGALSGSIGTTGPSSNNQVTENTVDTTVVTNSNNLGVSNSNGQGASSGTANVSGNTNGGSATSGSASNSNSSSVTLNVTN